MIIILEVSNNGQADKIGLKKNDLISSYDENLVLSKEHLLSLIQTAKIKNKESVSVNVIRESEQMSIEVNPNTSLGITFKTFDSSISNSSEEIKRKLSALIVVNTDSIDGYKVTHHLDIVNSFVTRGAGAITQYLAGFSNTFGENSGAYINKLNNIHLNALEEVKLEAVKRGANCILGLRINLIQLSSNDLITVQAIGTAAVIEAK